MLLTKVENKGGRAERNLSKERDLLKFEGFSMAVGGKREMWKRQISLGSLRVEK